MVTTDTSHFKVSAIIRYHWMVGALSFRRIPFYRRLQSIGRYHQFATRIDLGLRNCVDKGKSAKWFSWFIDSRSIDFRLNDIDPFTRHQSFAENVFLLIIFPHTLRDLSFIVTAHISDMQLWSTIHLNIPHTVECKACIDGYSWSSIVVFNKDFTNRKNLVSAKIRTRDLSAWSLPRCSIAAAANFHYSHQPLHRCHKFGPTQVVSPVPRRTTL